MAITELWKEDLDRIWLGATLLGSGGGGGSIYSVPILQTLLEHLPVKVCELSDVPPDAEVAVVCAVGAPTGEQIKFENSPWYSLKGLEEASSKKISYILPLETGGVNTLVPMLIYLNSQGNDVLLIDADGSGRSIPQLQMTTYGVDNIITNPSVIANEKAETEVLADSSAPALDAHIRDIVHNDPRFQTAVMLATFSMKGSEIIKPGAIVPNTILLAKRIGEALQLPNQPERINRIAEIMRENGRDASLLCDGHITQYDEGTKEGFSCGTITISPSAQEAGDYYKIDFVNENIVGWKYTAGGEKTPLWGPEMICFLSPEGKPFTTDDVAKEWTGNPIPVTLLHITPAGPINNPTIKEDFATLYEESKQDCFCD